MLQTNERHTIPILSPMLFIPSLHFLFLIFLNLVVDIAIIVCIVRLGGLASLANYIAEDVVQKVKNSP